MTLAVIDTNVLVSALISPSGNEAMVLVAVAGGLLRPCYSTDILVEYERVLARPKFSFARSQVARLLQGFFSHGRLVSVMPFSPVSSDEADDKFIACAVQSQAQFLVTGNKRHFPQEKIAFATVVSARELLDFITLDFP